MKVDTIIPCYNEEKRVGNVLDVLIKSKYINRVIVVDDCSTDRSTDVIKSFSGVKLVRHNTNQGKGQAIKTGLEYVKSDAVFLCDADLYGLEEQHIKKLTQEYLAHPANIIVGLTDKSNPILNWLQKNTLPLIAGFRIISTDLLRKILENPIAYGYGLELYTNYVSYKSRKRIRKIRMKGANDVPKYRKEAYGIVPHIKEGQELLQKYFEIYVIEMPKDVLKAGIDGISVRTKKIREVI